MIDAPDCTYGGGDCEQPALLDRRAGATHASRLERLADRHRREAWADEECRRR